MSVTPPAELVWVATADGHHVALHHTANAGRPAVVLCHGISSNHRFWDLAPGRSLVEALWTAGYDVWNLDLRGHGAAVRAPDGHRQEPGWSVDDYGTADLPAAFAHVRAASGQAELHYVGHSMGGMVLAVYLATTPEPGLASAVVVGSPLDFRDRDVLVEALFAVGPVGRALPRLPTPAGARVLAVTRRDTIGHVDEILHNPENVDRRAEALMLRTVVSPLWRGEVEQLRPALEDGEFRSTDGLVYRHALADVTVPMLFVAGRADRVVSPDRVWTYYESVGSSTDRQFLVASVANGMHGDYGHLDLGTGDHAAEDVFPPIVAWLDAHPAEGP